MATLFASTYHHPGEEKHWDYHGKYAPENWGELSSICRDGKFQTPIDIQTSETVALKRDSLEFFNYSTHIDADVLNNGHTIKVTPIYKHGYENSYITIDGKFYKLLQFHMHTHSESRIDGKQSDLVAHIVHQSDDGELAVVGVFFEEGEENIEITNYWDFMPKNSGETSFITDVNVSKLLPADLSGYYHFMGSLTTPPCTEGVKWFILKDKQTISKEQIDALRKIFPDNYRPIQDMNGRTVFER
jgi:carbonic anhydrase